MLTLTTPTIKSQKQATKPAPQTVRSINSRPRPSFLTLLMRTLSAVHC